MSLSNRIISNAAHHGCESMGTAILRSPRRQTLLEEQEKAQSRSGLWLEGGA
jgi:hypothetical protein